MLDRKDKYRILAKKLDRIALSMERAKLNEYVNYLDNPKKMFFANFIAGLARGFGASIGVVKLNLPIIGEFISDIVNIVNSNLKNTGR